MDPVKYSKPTPDVLHKKYVSDSEAFADHSPSLGLQIDVKAFTCLSYRLSQMPSCWFKAKHWKALHSSPSALFFSPNKSFFSSSKHIFLVLFQARIRLCCGKICACLFHRHDFHHNVFLRCSGDVRPLSEALWKLEPVRCAFSSLFKTPGFARLVFLSQTGLNFGLRDVLQESSPLPVQFTR